MTDEAPPTAWVIVAAIVVVGLVAVAAVVWPLGGSAPEPMQPTPAPGSMAGASVENGMVDWTDGGPTTRNTSRVVFGGSYRVRRTLRVVGEDGAVVRRNNLTVLTSASGTGHWAHRRVDRTIAARERVYYDGARIWAAGDSYQGPDPNVSVQMYAHLLNHSGELKTVPGNRSRFRNSKIGGMQFSARDLGGWAFWHVSMTPVIETRSLGRPAVRYVPDGFPENPAIPVERTGRPRGYAVVTEDGVLTEYRIRLRYTTRDGERRRRIATFSVTPRTGTVERPAWIETYDVPTPQPKRNFTPRFLTDARRTIVLSHSDSDPDSLSIVRLLENATVTATTPSGDIRGRVFSLPDDPAEQDTGGGFVQINEFDRIYVTRTPAGLAVAWPRESGWVFRSEASPANARPFDDGPVRLRITGAKVTFLNATVGPPANDFDAVERTNSSRVLLVRGPRGTSSTTTANRTIAVVTAAGRHVARPVGNISPLASGFRIWMNETGAHYVGSNEIVPNGTWPRGSDDRIPADARRFSPSARVVVTVHGFELVNETAAG